MVPKKHSFWGQVAVGNNLVIRDIMISTNDEGLMFSKSMEVLKNEAYGMSTVVAPKCFGWFQMLDLSFPIMELYKQSYLSSLLSRSFPIQ
jgi:hypothetical protein